MGILNLIQNFNGPICLFRGDSASECGMTRKLGYFIRAAHPTLRFASMFDAPAHCLSRT